MTQRFGDRRTFAVEVGELTSPSLRTVDLWAGGKWLNTDDNVAYVPSFCHAIRSTATRVRLGNTPPCPFPELSPEEIFLLLDADGTEFRERFWLMRWETVDNVSDYAYLDEEDALVIVFRFWRETHRFPEDLGKVFVARIPSDEFATTLQEAADFMTRA